MENRAVTADRIGPLDDAFDEEASGGKSLIRGLIYWGVLALGFGMPVIGGIWGILH